MACFNEVLEAANQIVQNKGKNEFSPYEIIDLLLKKGTIYKKKTIGHEVLRGCVNCNSKGWWIKTRDFYEKVEFGKYKIHPKYLKKTPKND